jgi:hypothetical protein
MRRAQMISVIVYDRPDGEPFSIEPELIKFVCTKNPRVTSTRPDGGKTIIYEMSQEEWLEAFPPRHPRDADTTGVPSKSAP